MDELEVRLAEYYDLEGDRRAAMALGPGRLARRAAFVEQVRAEGRATILDAGSGPGRDAIALGEAGLIVTALDRSPGHARRARSAGLTVVQASLLALPFPPATFDAGWTMSTLVHVPDERWDAAVGELVAVLRPGAPLAVGLWGGLDEERWQPPRHGLPSRFFSLRSHDRAEGMLARHGTVERFVTWAEADTDWQYQFAVVGTPGGGPVR